MTETNQDKQPFMIWIYSGNLSQVLDAATWLEPTRELRRMGWKIQLIAFGSEGSKVIHGVDVLTVPTIDRYFMRHFIFHLRLLPILLKNWSCTQFILFNQASVPWILPLKILRVIQRVKTPLMVMDTRTVLMEDIHMGTWKDVVRGWMYKITDYIANHWVDGQTANTVRMAECIGVPEHRFWGDWPAAAVTEEFLPARKARTWPKEDEPIQLIYIGVVNYERNLMAICKASEMANQAGMHFKITIVGDGTERKSLEDFALSSGGRVTIHKPVPHEQIPYFLATAHIGVIPFPDEAKFRVGSPIKLFEYLSAGLPILATRIVCITDVVNAAEFVFWAENSTVEGLYSALHDIWQNKVLLPQLGQEAAIASENFTWEKSTRKLAYSLKSHLS